jgi:rhodanese-related sulfurtransferase
MSWLDWLNTSPKNSTTTRIKAAELLEQIRRGKTPYVVDVREREELRGPLPALPKAKNIPLSEFGRRFTEIPRDKDIYLICLSGSRSQQAMKFLQGQGYTQVQNVEGGMMAVHAVGLR